MKTTLTVLLIASSLLFTAGASAETVYQWVNEEGVTQFGSQPPRGRDYRQIRTQTGHSEPVDYTSQYRQENAQEEPSSASPNANSQAEADRDEACRIARQNLESLERGGRIMVEDDNGQRRYLDEQEQAERAEQARRIQAQAC